MVRIEHQDTRVLGGIYRPFTCIEKSVVLNTEGYQLVALKPKGSWCLT